MVYDNVSGVIVNRLYGVIFLLHSCFGSSGCFCLLCCGLLLGIMVHWKDFFEVCCLQLFVCFLV